MRLLRTRLTPGEPQLIHCLPDQIKSGSRCLSLFFREVDLIALRGLSAHAALIRGSYSDRADCRMTLWLPFGGGAFCLPGADHAEQGGCDDDKTNPGVRALRHDK